MFCVLAIAATACGSSKSSSGGTTPTTGARTSQTLAATTPPKSGGSITVGLEAEQSGFNPISSSTRWDISGTEEGLALYDPMVAFDENGNWKPYLAKSFVPNSSYTQWTVTMRSGVLFQDGTPLTADTVVEAYKAFIGGALTGPVFSDVASVQSTGPLTLTFDMKSPWVSFPAQLTSQVGMIPAPSTMVVGTDGKVSAAPGSDAHPVGSGPFKYKSWVPNSQFDMVKNPSYWRKDTNGVQLPYLDAITFKPITDHGSRDSAMEAGDIQVEQNDNAMSLLNFRKEAESGKVQLVEDNGPGEESDFVILNTQDPALKDPTVRQALAYATNRSAYNTVINDGVLEDANGPFKPISKWYTPTTYPNFDLTKAKALVAQYTAKNGHPPTFTLGATNDTSSQQGAALLQQMWDQAGMKISIKSYNQTDFINQAVVGNYQANLWRQFGAIDPDTDALWWYSANAGTSPSGGLTLNIARNKDPLVDQALDKGRQATTFAGRKAAYDQLQQRFAVDVPYVWLQHVIWFIVAANNVRGLTNGPLPDGETSLPIGGGGDFGGVIRWTQMWLTNA
jgi:peptide/nickel transport system substrate-binding protein